MLFHAQTVPYFQCIVKKMHWGSKGSKDATKCTGNQIKETVPENSVHLCPRNVPSEQMEGFEPVMTPSWKKLYG